MRNDIIQDTYSNANTKQLKTSLQLRMLNAQKCSSVMINNLVSPSRYWSWAAPLLILCFNAAMTKIKVIYEQFSQGCQLAIHV